MESPREARHSREFHKDDTIMKIYTKTGDKGETSLFGGKRVRKDNSRIEAYGNADELNSCIGVVRSFAPPSEIDAVLAEIQNDLFVLGADLATPGGGAKTDVQRIGPGDVVRLERHIDRIDELLPELRSFIVPGGSQVASFLHLARTICRRCERGVVVLSHEDRSSESTIVYLNRLSDLLFVLARYSNKLSERPDIPWKAR